MSRESRPIDAAISLSLVSHTNVGKTTLARTLLRRDVGEVLDQAHVTDEAEPFVLLDPGQDGGVLLWDTPGFGDSARLLKRLEGQSSPLGWILSQAWDRFADRPLWCSQQAVKNIREESDAVLYLVNAAEDPDMAGYLGPELAILDWAEVPVIAVLNYTGAPVAAAARGEEEERWRAVLSEHAAVRDVVSLDAFARCWVQEGVLLERIRDVVPPARHEPMKRLIEEWSARNLEIFRGSLARFAELVAMAAADRERPGVAPVARLARRHAVDQLVARHRRELRAATADVITLHGLEGEGAAALEATLEDVSAPGERRPPWQASVLGGAAGGALGGLAADVASGGLTFGGGAVAGALLGAMGLGGLAWSVRQLGGEEDPRVTWSTEFLDRATRDALLRYLSIAHFGRGSGEYEERAVPDFWRPRAERALSTRRGAMRDAWSLAQSDDRDDREAGVRAALERLAPLLQDAAREVLLELYPGTERFVGGWS